MPKAKKGKRSRTPKRGEIISTGGFLTPTGSPKQQEIAEIATRLGGPKGPKITVTMVQLVQAATRRVTGKVKGDSLKARPDDD